ncbi:MOSC domain-containing protein [Actinotalea sp. M2MS4P-6]|uniref:MOSC domain-containing protein n=1 Tax=Actinotalea sp. M2MS4P-6 TaxID=2983762 RepID=UPI0021E47D9D|nr:MOSC domain-containing protein [Actinotalea sp. M2MS4P-6]MCV2393939.1 MOSC domain-containing protein [Actinotalea sp. M2MS4P-6]
MEPSVVGTVTAVCAVQALHADDGIFGVTAIDKRPVTRPVRVGPYGLRGDVQADRKHHGGHDKALYVVDDAEGEYWSAELGRDVPPGLFGENLRMSGLAVDDAVIGERWLIGAEVEVEVTGPRTPCATFARWLGQDGWVRRYTERGRPGVYLRVRRGGTLAAGDDVTRVSRPGHGVTVAEVFAGLGPGPASAVLADDGFDLADYLRRPLESAAARDGR